MLKTVTIAVLNGCLVHATLQQIDEALTSYFNESDVFRAVGGPGVSQIQDYGCWCYFPENAEELHSGKGHPQDPIDTVCQTLSHGYECAHIESEDHTCEPWTQFYYSIWGQKSAHTPEEIWTNCLDNQDIFTNWSAEERLCAARACAVENEFLRSYTLVLQKYNVDPSLSHANGFNASESCAPKTDKKVGNGGNSGGNDDVDDWIGSYGGGTGGNGGNKDDNSTGDQGDDGQVHKECCGVYPNRFPYHSISSAGFKQCCVDKTYNDLMHVCCDGTIQAFCSEY